MIQSKHFAIRQIQDSLNRNTKEYHTTFEIIWREDNSTVGYIYILKDGKRPIEIMPDVVFEIKTWVELGKLMNQLNKG